MDKHINMVEEYKYSKVQSYGTNPPENSTPVWGNNNPTEDDVVDLIDFQTSLQKLTSTEREIIILVNQGYSKREIAEMIDLPETTTQDIKQRAITKLRGMMNGKDNLYSVFA